MSISCGRGLGDTKPSSTEAVPLSQIGIDDGTEKTHMTDLHPIDADADDPGTDELAGPLVVGNSRHGVLQGMKEFWIMTGVFCFASRLYYQARKTELLDIPCLRYADFSINTN